jgi:acyl-CoA dehydrogenase
VRVSRVRSVSLRTATIARAAALFVYSVVGAARGGGSRVVARVRCAAVPEHRAAQMRYLTKPFLRTYRRLLPAMSDTEREALEAGTVWWDGELFTGRPDWTRLLAAKAPKLSQEEQAFIDGPCEELCRLIDDWDITHRRADLSPHVWEFIKKKGFFAMIIPKKYGGLEFSAYAHRACS